MDPLLRAAKAATRRSYAPYSKYRVGAAIEANDGSVFTGCNVENVSYGLTICAERSAVSAAVGAGYRHFRRIAIAASGAKPPFPCGACRQVLSEFANGLEVIVSTRTGVRRCRLADLLPRAFSSKKSASNHRGKPKSI